MKAIELAIAAALAATGCKGVFGPSIEGSGKPGTRTVTVGSGKDVGEFKKIESNGSFNVQVKIGPQSDLTITGDDNIVKIVEVAVNGDTLVVKTNQNFSSNLPIMISVTMPELTGASTNGSGNISVDGINGQEVAFSVSGSGNIDATGKAESVTADISGSGEISVEKLAAHKLNADISGSGSVKANVSDQITASIAGSGDVLYKGSPKDVTKAIAGSGSVKPF